MIAQFITWLKNRAHEVSTYLAGAIVVLFSLPQLAEDPIAQVIGGVIALLAVFWKDRGAPDKDTSRILELLKKILPSLLSGLVVGMVALPAYGQCLSLTGNNHSLIVLAESALPTEEHIRAVDADGTCIGETAVENGHFAFPLWGKDRMAAQGTGPVAGESYHLLAVSPENGFAYNLEADYVEEVSTPADATYEPGGITVVTLRPAPGDTVRAYFVEPFIEARGDFDATLRIEADGPEIGALIAEFNLDGVTVDSLSPAAETYINADTAAVFVGHAGQTVFDIHLYGPSSVGHIALERLRVTDTEGNLLHVDISGPLAVSIAPLLVGDVSGDGSLTSSDVRLLFLDLIGAAAIDPAGLKRADVYPHPQGMGKLT